MAQPTASSVWRGEPQSEASRTVHHAHPTLGNRRIMPDLVNDRSAWDLRTVPPDGAGDTCPVLH